MKRSHSFIILFLLSCLFCAAKEKTTIVPGEKDNSKKCRIVLEKNIVGGKNILTQELFDKHGSNKKYIIKHDYSIDGAIKIPSNCIVVFKGGSFRNGTVDFNNCTIESKKKALYDVHFTNLQKVNIDYFYIPTDATCLLQDIVNSSTIVDLKGNTFNLSRCVEVNGNSGLFELSNGTINALKNFEIHKGEALSSVGSLLYFHDINNGSIKNLTLNGNRHAQKGLSIIRCNDIAIDSCCITNFDGTDKSMSWGIRCGECTNIKLENSSINNIIASPIGVNGGAIGSAAGVVFEHTRNAYINNNVIENVQSVRDGDALHIINLPCVNGVAMPSMEELYEDVNVVISHNIIKANVDSKRCIKIQANGVSIINNYIQKKYLNKTNVISIYGSNITISDNTIDSYEKYSIGIGSAYLNTIHDIKITNNLINHNTTSNWGACIYIVRSSLYNVIVDSNTVLIPNSLNMFCDSRSSISSSLFSNNNVEGGSHFFHIKNEVDNTTFSNLQLVSNRFNGNFDFLSIEKDGQIKTIYNKIIAIDNVFYGGDNSFKMFDVANDSQIIENIQLGQNISNKSVEL